MFIQPDPVVEVRDEYRSGTGKVLTAGDEVKVEGRSGRYTFRETLRRASGKVDLMLVGRTGQHKGKHAYATPSSCARTGKGALPKGATTAHQRWGDLVADAEGEALPAPRQERPEVELPEGHEELTCQACGGTFTRKRVRGRKPKHCPDCR